MRSKDPSSARPENGRARDDLFRAGRVEDALQLITDAMLDLPPGGDTEEFLYESITITILLTDAQAAIQSWLEIYSEAVRKEAPGDQRRAAALESLRLVARVRNRNSLDDFDGHSGKSFANEPWALILQIHVLVNEGKTAEALDLIHGRLTAESESYYRSVCAIRVCYHFVDRSELAEFEGLSEQIFGWLSSSQEFISRLREYELIGMRGRLLFNLGEFERAKQDLETVLEAHRQFGGRTGLGVYRQELAMVHTHLGNFDEARAILDETDQLAPEIQHVERIRVQLIRAEIAHEECDLDVARRAIREARSIWDRFPHNRMEPYILVASAKVEARSGTESAHARAFHYLDRAEELLRRLKSRGLHGLAKVLVTRGQIHLERDDIEQALKSCVQSMELAVRENFFPTQVRCLLLKSYLLLESDLPASESIYESILRKLGLIHNPIILFKVIANLYLYSWELSDRLDISDGHLEQLNSLKSSIDSELYSNLYTELVTQRVFDRFL